MKIATISLFPSIFPPILDSSILKRAQNKGLFEYHLINLRDFGEGVHQVVDDKPFGGGTGMVLKANILTKAWQEAARILELSGKPFTILMSASGKRFDEPTARKLSSKQSLIIVCGHYEGIDQRFIDNYVDEEISIGDFVLTGGELPAMVITDAIVRLIPGVLSNEDASTEESFSLKEGESRLLEYPHYTRPNTFEGKKVPDVLISGNHQEVSRWRKEQALQKTKTQRPDLLKE